MTTTVDRPPLRLLRAPAFDPPYDDEAAAASPTVDGNLALAFPTTGGDGVPLRLVPPALAPRGTVDGGPVDRPALPEPRQWVGRLTQAIVEVLAGARSAAQLSPYASLRVLTHLERATGRLRRGPAGAPARRPVVRSVRVSQPNDAVVEACAVIDTGPRRRAVALRLQAVEGRWQCTALEIG